MNISRRVLLSWLGALAAPSWAEPIPSGFASNFAGASLTDQEGREFKLESLAGRALLFNFVYTGCSTVCPVQTKALAEVQRRLAPAVRDRVHFVSVSLDPLSDTPAALKAYALRMGSDLKHWSFVTGKPTDIARVSERLRLFKPSPKVKRPDDHATSLWLVNRQGLLVQRYQGNPPDVARLANELASVVA